MIVTCPNCTTRLQLDKGKIPSRPFSVRCPKCQQIVNAQPPSPASPQRDALAAVGGLPASSRPQQETVVAPVVKEEAAGGAPQPAAEGEVLKLLASLLRGGGALEGGGAKASGRRPAWENRCALVCMGSAYADEVVLTLSNDGYEIFVASDVGRAMERLHEGGVDVLVLDMEFDPAHQGAAQMSRELAVLRMRERRRIVFVMLSDKARTGDAHAAFLTGANLVVNLSDAAELPRALEKNVRNLNELYRDFNQALGLAEL